LSPFAGVIDRLTTEIRVLPPRGQVAIFLTAAVVLAEDWQEWCRAAGRVPDDAVFARAITVATDFACGRPVSASSELASAIESAVPDEPSDVPGFTAAQDCWICLDTAVQGATHGDDAASSTWYLLEPLFGSVSMRLFGVSDVGSEAQEAAESTALDDAVLSQGIAAVEACISRLAANPVDESQLVRLRSTLSVLRP
jgi:hypothetical protein